MSDFARTPLKRVLREVNDPSPDGKGQLFMLGKRVGLVPRDSNDGFSEAVTYQGYKRFRPGDLVMNKMQAWNGVFGYSFESGLVSPDYAVFRLLRRDAADIRFLNYLAHTPFMIGQFAALSRGMGTGFNRLHPEPFLSISATLPPLGEQRRIADFLDDQVTRIDQAIQLRKRQAELAKVLQISTVRFATTRRGGAVRSSGIPWMPEVNASWRLVRVGSAFSTGSGSTPPSDNQAFYNGGLPWILTGDLNDGLVTQTKRTISEAATSQFGTLRAYPAGSLVIAMYGATIGRLGLLGMPASVNQACCVLTNETAISTRFAFYWFLGQRSEIVNLGAGGGQPNISQELVRSLRIPTPSSQEQRSVVAELDQTVASTSQLLHRQSEWVALLEERKRSLITAAVTGEFDVSSASVRASGVAMSRSVDQ